MLRLVSTRSSQMAILKLAEINQKAAMSAKAAVEEESPLIRAAKAALLSVYMVMALFLSVERK